ncbi:hypothetical protein ASE66_25530 [Bosea sp. Root483D1]|nr:hypothetical protein ASE66_25530 [Bosea sp. Root483D1]
MGSLLDTRQSVLHIALNFRNGDLIFRSNLCGVWAWRPPPAKLCSAGELICLAKLIQRVGCIAELLSPFRPAEHQPSQARVL